MENEPGFTQAQGLELIQSMINKAKNRWWHLLLGTFNDCSPGIL